MQINGLNLNVRDTGGAKPTIVFLHYWGGSSQTWRPVIDLLSNDFRCIAIDLRGWGESDKTATDYSLAAQADDVRMMIAALDLTDYSIVGHSMGGKIAQIIASDRPPGLRRLILIAPAPPTPMRAPKEQRRMMLKSYQSMEGAQQALSILTEIKLPANLQEQVFKDTLKGAPEAKRAWTESGMIADISDTVGSISIAVLIVIGDSDKVEQASVLRQEFGRLVPQSKFAVLPGVGHLSPLEAHILVADVVRKAMNDR